MSRRSLPAPTTINDYAENAATSVATYTAADPEGDTSITWSVGGTDRSDFDVTGGVLTLKNAPDYERPADSGSNNHYEVTIYATDSNNKRGELHVDVIVQNVDEPPEITESGTLYDFPENSPTSRQVGRYTASDPEGATVTLSLSSGGANFTLASNGVLTFAQSPDYEEQSRYIVTVRAVAGSHTVNKTVTVNIQNAEEPGAVSLSTVQPQEGTPLTVTLDDDDGPTGTSWEWYRTSQPRQHRHCHYQRNVGHIRARRRRRGQLPAGRRFLRRRPRRRQDRRRRQRQPGSRSAA